VGFSSRSCRIGCRIVGIVKEAVILPPLTKGNTVGIDYASSITGLSPMILWDSHQNFRVATSNSSKRSESTRPEESTLPTVLPLTRGGVGKESIEYIFGNGGKRVE
jgi:hypothetical protein